MSAALRYRIFPKDPAAHLYEVSLTVDKPDPSGQVFAMSAWIPGSYMIRDYARHVVAIRAEADGVAVELRKIDKSRWQAAPTKRPLTIVAEIYAHDATVRGARANSPSSQRTKRPNQAARSSIQGIPWGPRARPRWKVAT